MGQGYIFTGICDSVHRRRGYPSMHCRWYPSMPCSRSPGGGWYPSMPCRFPGPQPRGKLWETWSRPTAKREIEGDLVQAHSQGGCWGGSGQGVESALGGPALGGCLLWGVPALGGGVPALEGMWRDTPTCDGYCCGRYASYWNAFLLYYKFNILYFLELSKQGDAHHNNRSACVRARRVLSEFLWKYSTGKIIWLQEVRTHVKYLSLQEPTNNVSNKAETKRIIS